MVDSQHRLLVRRLWVGRLPDAFAQPFPRVLLEEALLGYPARTADERKRAAGDIGRDVRPHLGVIVRETRLGDSRAGPVEPVPLGELGRASCRERVCLYVERQVVAVSLKNKTTHIIYSSVY